MKKIVTLFLALAMAWSSTAFAEKTIVVGGKFFTEQYIMAEISKQVLEKNGFTVVSKVGLGSNLVRQAQEKGEVDLYWEYTGTSLVAYNKIKESLNKQQTYDRVKAIDAKKDIIWLKSSKANNTFAIAMRASEAKKRGIHTLSDLSKKYKKENLKIALTAEFIGRADGLKRFEEVYNTKVARANIKSMDDGLIYKALKDGQVDAGIVFSTDGRIAAYNFEVLKDDKALFPDYSLAPVIRAEVLKKNPSVEQLMVVVSDALNDSVLQDLNSAVDIDGKSVSSVAEGFVKTLKF